MRGERRSRYKRKMFFGRDDRILLHLLSYVGYEDQVERPDELTQFGIAIATGLGRSTISKSLRSLMKRGLVKDQRAHVPSGKLRRTTYLLTDRGFKLAQSLKIKISEELIVIQEGDGATRRLPLKDIPRQLPIYASMLDVVVHVSEGVFDVPSFINNKDQKPGLVDFTNKMPKQKYFFGRVDELNEMDRWLTSRNGKLLTVVGIPGIGKTSLLVKWLEKWRKSTNLFWYRIFDWSSPLSILRQFAKFLDRLDRRNLSNYITAGNEFDLEEVTDLLDTDLDRLDAILIFDDCHKASDDVERFLFSFKLVLDNASNTKLITAGRSVPNFYDRRDVKVNGLVREMELNGLDQESSYKLLTLRNADIQRQTLKLIYKVTKGHPLFMELIDPVHGTENRDIMRYLEEDLITRLSSDELSILQIASIYRHPVASEALLVENHTDAGNLQFLLDQNLLREVSLNLFEIHELLKDFFRMRLSPQAKKEYEKLAAQYYLSLGSDDDILEAIYHLFEGGEGRKGSKLLAEKGLMISKNGHTEELANLLKRTEKLKLRPHDKLKLLMLKGDVLTSLADWGGALRIYEEAVQLSRMEGSPRPRATALKAIGDIRVRRHEWVEATNALKESMSIYDELDDAKGLAASHFSLGALYEQRGDLKKALRHYRRASRLVDGEKNLEGVTQYLYAYSRVLGARGEKEKSIKLKREALSAAERAGNIHEIARITVALGYAYMESDDLEQAYTKYQEGINLARRIGNMRIVAYGLMNTASLVLRRRNTTVAEANLMEATKIFERLGEKVPIGLCQIDMAFIDDIRGNWEMAKSHLQNGIRILRDNRSPLDLLNSSIAAAGLYARHNENKVAMELYSSSKSMARQLGRVDLLNFIDEQMSLIKQGSRPKYSGVAVPG